MNQIYRECPLIVQGSLFSADLMELPFHEFDIILGMDWLCVHRAVVDCSKKRLTLYTPNNNEILVVGKRSNYLTNVISATTTSKLIWKGCEAYLAYIWDTCTADPKLPEIPIACDYPDVFLEELPRLPQNREVEFAIEVAPGTNPIPWHRIEWLQPN